MIPLAAAVAIGNISGLVYMRYKYLTYYLRYLLHGKKDPHTKHEMIPLATPVASGIISSLVYMMEPKISLPYPYLRYLKVHDDR